MFVIPALGGAERKVATVSLRGGRLASSDHLKFPTNLTWTPDAKWIAFGGRPSDDETPGIWLIAADSSQKRRLTQVTGHEFGDWGPAFSPDGRKLAFTRQRTLSASAVYVLPLSSEFTPAGAPERLTRESAAIQGLAWTPDGSGLVFIGRSSRSLANAEDHGSDKTGRASGSDSSVAVWRARHGNQHFAERPAGLRSAVQRHQPVETLIAWTGCSRNRTSCCVYT